jgi:hypothetical protein
MKTFEILAKSDPDAIESGYGTEEATSARELMARILGDLDHYHIADDIQQITIGVADPTDYDEPSVAAFRDGESWSVKQPDNNGGEWEVHQYDGEEDEVIGLTALVSFDNGNTYYDPIDDIDEITHEVHEKTADGITDDERKMWWDEIASFMDDEAREDTYNDLFGKEYDNAAFLVSYLKRAARDLIIG